MTERSISRHYVVVRTDIPLVTQIISVAHACRLAGALFGVPEYAHITLLGVPDQVTLLGIFQLSEEYGLIGRADDIGWTALCTRALTGNRPEALYDVHRWKSGSVAS